MAMANPLAEDAGVMRTSGLVSLAAALERNINRGQRSVRLFEIGRAYRMKGAETEEVPVVTIGATGFAREKGVAESAREFSFADLKGDLDRIGDLAGGILWSAGATEWSHPARTAKISLAGGSSSIGIAGQLSRAAARPKLRRRYFLAQILLEPFHFAYGAARSKLRYRGHKPCPAAERNFSLLLRDGILFAQVADAIRGLGIAEIISVDAVDLFRGGQVPAGQYSLLVRVTFQSYDATLTEAQIGSFSERIVSALGSAVAASLRTA